MRLELMSADELASYRERTIVGFAAEKARSEGIGEEEALEAATAAVDRTGFGGEDHVIGHLVSDEDRVGVLWFVQRTEWGRPSLWLYEIEIHEAFRGKGFGRAAMELFEREATERGVECLGLHVFGHNETARALYEKLGYRPTSIVMRKDL